jgi:hypothetical protein
MGSLIALPSQTKLSLQAAQAKRKGTEPATGIGLYRCLIRVEE